MINVNKPNITGKTRKEVKKNKSKGWIRKKVISKGCGGCGKSKSNEKKE